MADPLVNLTIEGQPVSVPPGTLLVDAAKQAGVYVPVFCYHPKLEPVGMCRMCLVEIGRPARDRASGEFVTDDAGQPVMEFGPNLETACTTPVGEGWVVRTASEKSLKGQSEIVEFLLTSHPLDCPICDKGGECPLQELTMDFGAGKSRFHYGDKMKLGKHVPLGDLIFLDQERCIQCARCTRFQDEIVADPVIGFEERGRKLQIVTYSQPGFDSYFSGNTTDICPVGALTTSDFRFEARPWELNAAASICTHCPVGCNTMVNTRRQPDAGGAVSVQRVMPRQNEAVNEIWLCDKGRFAHHYAGAHNRQTQPMVRHEGEWKEVDWDEALAQAAEGLGGAEGKVIGLTSGRPSNEDLYQFRLALQAMGGDAVLTDSMFGGDWVASHGLTPGSNLGDLGAGDAVLIVAADLHEEAPIWWLRVKQASQRGARLIVANPWPTRLDRHADRVLHFQVGKAVAAIKELHSSLTELNNLVVFFGRDGLRPAEGEAVAAACAGLLEKHGQPLQPNNGLVPVWPRANTQGAWDVGLRPNPAGAAEAVAGVKALWLMAAEAGDDDPGLAQAVAEAEFVVVQDLRLGDAADYADVFLPAQSPLEREGTLTSGERRLQRYYPVLPAPEQTRPDWQIVTQLAAALEIELAAGSASAVFAGLADTAPAYHGLSYADLSRSEPQWPAVGGDDLYFGGTAYKNQQGIGIQLPLAQTAPSAPEAPPAAPASDDGLTLLPVSRLYDHGATVLPTQLLSPRIAPIELVINPADADRLELADGDWVAFDLHGQVQQLPLRTSTEAPAGSALLARSQGIALNGPVSIAPRRTEAPA